MVSDREFEVAEGDTSAQTDLEKFLQNPATDQDDDHRKPVESEDNLEYFASSSFAEEVENFLTPLSAEAAGICTFYIRLDS